MIARKCPDACCGGQSRGWGVGLDESEALSHPNCHDHTLAFCPTCSTATVPSLLRGLQPLRASLALLYPGHNRVHGVQVDFFIPFPSAP